MSVTLMCIFKSKKFYFLLNLVPIVQIEVEQEPRVKRTTLEADVCSRDNRGKGREGAWISSRQVFYFLGRGRLERENRGEAGGEILSTIKINLKNQKTTVSS